MSAQKKARANVSALLQAAQIAIGESIAMPDGQMHVLEPAQWCGRRVLVFEGKERSLTLATRFEIPEMSPLLNVAVTSAEALLLLGTLTFSLQGHDAEVKLVSGKQGLEAIMVNRRLCAAEITAPTLRQELKQLQDIVQMLEPMLALSGQALIDSVLERVRPVIFAPTQQTLKTEPLITPTFDEEARNRMMQQMKK